MSAHGPWCCAHSSEASFYDLALCHPHSTLVQGLEDWIPQLYSLPISEKSGHQLTGVDGERAEALKMLRTKVRKQALAGIEDMPLDPKARMSSFYNSTTVPLLS